MTYPLPPVRTKEQLHDLHVHVQYHHDAMPPYDGTIEEVHGWLHEDREDERDWNHAADEIVLPPRRMYPTSGPRRYSLPPVRVADPELLLGLQVEEEKIDLMLLDEAEQEGLAEGT